MTANIKIVKQAGPDMFDGAEQAASTRASSSSNGSMTLTAQTDAATQTPTPCNSTWQDGNGRACEELANGPRAFLYCAEYSDHEALTPVGQLVHTGRHTHKSHSTDLTR